MPLANLIREMAARMTAEDCEPDVRIAAAVGTSLSTIEHRLKQIDETRTGVAHKEAVVNPCSSKELKAEIRLCETK
jgi:hypothetical protein